MFLIVCVTDCLQLCVLDALYSIAYLCFLYFHCRTEASKDARDLPTLRQVNVSYSELLGTVFVDFLFSK